MHTTPKVALVTGASSGFGLATAARLSAQSFRVFGTSRAPSHNEASSVELLPLDVTSETSVQTCVQTILVVNRLKVRTQILGRGPLVRTFSPKRMGRRFDTISTV